MKISQEEWGKVRTMAEEIAFSKSYKSKDFRLKQRRFFYYLSRLEKKYGKDPCILATKADFQAVSKKSILLLKEAYDIALKQHDYQNCMLISSSLSSKYIMWLKDVFHGKIWLDTLKKSLKLFPDDYYANEHKELKAELEALGHIQNRKKRISKEEPQ